MQKKHGITKEIANTLSIYIKEEDFSGSNFYTPRSLDKALSMIINEVPTPYSKRLMPGLIQTIVNQEEEEITLSKGKVLAVGESISWLELIKHKKQLTKSV